MTVSTIASIAAGITRATSTTTTNKASTVLDSLVSNVGRSQTTDSADLGAAIKLQNQVASLRVASQNVAQANSVLTAAGTGATEITKALTKMKDLAAQASDPALTDEERVALNSQFQAARSDITKITESTSFNGEKLLTGTSEQLKVSGDTAGQKSLSVGSFVQDVLFPSSGPDPLDISTVASAKDAFPAAFAALNYAAQQTGNIFALQDGLDYASTTLESAIQNQDAARSTLSESDFNAVDANSSTSTIDTLLAQTNRLPNNILQLLSE